MIGKEAAVTHYLGFLVFSVLADVHALYSDRITKLPRLCCILSWAQSGLV